MMRSFNKGILRFVGALVILFMLEDTTVAINPVSKGPFGQGRRFSLPGRLPGPKRRPIYTGPAPENQRQVSKMNEKFAMLAKLPKMFPHGVPNGPIRLPQRMQAMFSKKPSRGYFDDF
ncbi:uncharacterized protein LOC119165875 isoform X1 [Rhipicephalus microplus]|uniref:uncharacterized protein LOC119165875 isoform X1 n=1 Tax=Rhipicephalus microplus TaxID=6941 RepID=UPI003F6C52E8